MVRFTAHTLNTWKHAVYELSKGLRGGQSTATSKIESHLRGVLREGWHLLANIFPG